MSAASEQILVAIHDAIDGWLKEIHDLLDERSGSIDSQPDTLVEALDALPEGTVVRSSNGNRFRKNREGNWCWTALRDPVARTTGWIAEYAPIGIESIPGEDVLPGEHPAGAIGWLDIDDERYLAREVEGGWADDDCTERAVWPREAFPSAEFTPILDPATQVVVNRDDLHCAVTVLDALDPFLDAESERWLTRLRAALGGEDQ